MVNEKLNYFFNLSIIVLIRRAECWLTRNRIFIFIVLSRYYCVLSSLSIFCGVVSADKVWILALLLLHQILQAHLLLLISRAWSIYLNEKLFIKIRGLLGLSLWILLEFVVKCLELLLLLAKLVIAASMVVALVHLLLLILIDWHFRGEPIVLLAAAKIVVVGLLIGCHHQVASVGFTLLQIIKIQILMIVAHRTSLLEIYRLLCLLLNCLAWGQLFGLSVALGCWWGAVLPDLLGHLFEHWLAKRLLLLGAHLWDSHIFSFIFNNHFFK